MYRVLLFFRYLEYNLVVSLFTTTMVRNFVYIMYAAHWAGVSCCISGAFLSGRIGCVTV